MVISDRLIVHAPVWKLGAGFESGVQANCDAVCQREVHFRPRNDRVLHVDTVRTELRSELRVVSDSPTAAIADQ